MIIFYEFGFNFNGVVYGFHKKKLYRLPQTIGKRFYSLKEIKLISEKRKSGTFKGYQLYGNHKKSIHQIKSMTNFINIKSEIIESEDLPF